MVNIEGQHRAEEIVPSRTTLEVFVAKHATQTSAFEEECFGTREVALPSLEPGHLFLKTDWIGLEPYMRMCET